MYMFFFTPLALIIPKVNLTPASHNEGEWVKRQEAPVKEWPLAMLGNNSRGKVLLEPLVVDYSFFQRPSKAFTVDEVKDGETLDRS